MRRAARLLAFASIAWLATPACARAPATIADEPGGSEPSRAAWSEPDVKPSDGVTVLVDAGAEPRALLRYHPQVGDQIRWSMVMQMTTTMLLLGQSQQTQFGIELGSSTEVVAVDEAKQEHEYRSNFVTARLLTEPVDPAAVEAAIAPFLDLEYWTRSSARGEPLEFHYSRNGEPVDPSTIPGLDNPVAAMMTYPEEPVGVGARWRRYDEVERNGFRVLQTSEHRLVRRDGDRLEIATTVTQTPMSTTMRTADMAANAHVELQHFDASGSGTSVHELTLPIPVAAQLGIEVDMSALIFVDDQQAEMAMQMSLDTRVSRSE